MKKYIGRAILSIMTLAAAVGIVTIAIKIGSDHNREIRNMTTTATTTAEVTTTSQSLQGKPLEEANIWAANVRLKFADKTSTQPKRLVMYQEDFPIASVNVTDDTTCFRLLNYEIGATGAAYANIEVDGKYVQAISNDMYWEPSDRSDKSWRVYAEMKYVDDVFATTVTTREFRDVENPHGGYFVGLNTKWRLYNGQLYADDTLITDNVRSVEYFPLVGTVDGWYILRYDRKTGWHTDKYVLYEDLKDDLFGVIGALQGVGQIPIDIGVSENLRELGFTLDDMDTLKKTVFVN